jgi:sugar-specific transcriptional regulator TrmB
VNPKHPKTGKDQAMIFNERLRELGFSKYEISCHLALVNHHPANGFQISRVSGISRSRIYDILRKMLHKGLVNEVGEGPYLPLPPEELIKRLKSQFESNLALLKEEVDQKPLVCHLKQRQSAP